MELIIGTEPANHLPVYGEVDYKKIISTIEHIRMVKSIDEEFLLRRKIEFFQRFEPPLRNC